MSPVSNAQSSHLIFSGLALTVLGISERIIKEKHLVHEGDFTFINAELMEAPHIIIQQTQNTTVHTNFTEDE